MPHTPLSMAMFGAFLIGFSTALALLHFYLYSRFKGAFGPGGIFKKIISAAFFISLASLSLSGSTQEIASTLPAVILAWAVYFWIGFLFYFLIIGLFFDLLRLLRLPVNLKASFFIAVAIVIPLLAYGFTERNNIGVEHVEMISSKLPKDIKKIRVVQISDTHFSQISGFEDAKRIVALIKENHPDILVSTGDFLDKGTRDRNEIAILFGSIDAPLGKYAVTGNHEFIAGIENSKELLEQSGFRLLRGTGLVVNNTVSIVGVDDTIAKRFDVYMPPESRTLQSFPMNKFTILLKHQPKINPKSIGFFDLQLSGHTHGGQIFPFSIITSQIFKYHHGFFDLGRGSNIYVSRGAGTWGPPVRILARPEITVIDVLKKQ